MNRKQRRNAIRMVLLNLDESVRFNPNDALCFADPLPDDDMQSQPLAGMQDGEHGTDGVCELVDWWSDGEDSRHYGM